MAVGGVGDRSLEITPTWAVAVVCAVFVIISVIIEHGIHSIGKWFQKRHKKAMSEALEKIKAELMLLGFISLLLTAGTKPVSRICIPKNAANTMLPCSLKHYDNGGGSGNDDHKKEDGDYNDGGRKLLSDLAQDLVWRRALAASAKEKDYCAEKDKVALVSQTGVHQLHIFIFVLAVFHILYSVLTMALGQAKMKKWKSWELETISLEYQYTNDPARFRFTSQTSFVKRHSGLSTTPGIRWVVAFFRQFFGSITKVDYFTMRHGFINAHLAPNSKFDFHKYIKRSLEDDFKVVVGISIPLWTFAVIFLLLNVYKWYTLFWISFLPLIILLLVGMKLEIIIMEMALQIQERTAIVEGAPVVEPSNELFWFNRPQWILFLIHFTLFQSAFQMAYFLWIVYSFGITKCVHENLAAILIPAVLGVVIQILCSYITFPLYALVTQMGSHMKTSIFEEQTAKALTKWRIAAKHRKKYRKSGMGGGSPTILMNGENAPTGGSSPVHLLRNHKSNSTDDIENVHITSPISYNSETDFSETDEAATPRSAAHDRRRESSDNDSHELRHNQYHDSIRRDGKTHSSDFSFGNQRK